MQLAGALRCVHGQGMALRCLSAKRVLRTSGGRLRVGCAGVVDVLEFEARTAEATDDYPWDHPSSLDGSYAAQLVLLEAKKGEE